MLSCIRKTLQHTVQLLRIVVVNGLKFDIQTAADTEAHDSGRHKQHNLRAGLHHETPLQILLNSGNLQFRTFPFVPAIETEQEEGDVFAGTANHTEAGHFHCISNAGLLTERGNDPLHQRLGLFFGRPFRKLQGPKDYALILFW